MDASKKISNLKFIHGLVDSLVGKYGVTLLANYLIATPLMTLSGSADTDIMELYSRCAGLMVNLCNALGKLSTSSRERSQFVNLTSKISKNLAIFEEASSGSTEMDGKCKP